MKERTLSGGRYTAVEDSIIRKHSMTDQELMLGTHVLSGLMKAQLVGKLHNASFDIKFELCKELAEQDEPITCCSHLAAVHAAAASVYYMVSAILDGNDAAAEVNTDAARDARAISSAELCVALPLCFGVLTGHPKHGDVFSKALGIAGDAARECEKLLKHGWLLPEGEEDKEEEKFCVTDVAESY